MRSHYLALAAVIIFVAVFPSRAAAKPRPAQAGQPKFIWTNEDLEQLTPKGLISIVGQVPEAAPQAVAQAQVTTASPEAARYASKLEDPVWYAQQAADLQAELDRRVAALREAQDGLSQAAKGITQPGIAMDKGNVGITPEAGIAILSAQVLEVQNQLDELSDLARQNGIPPGVLRG